MESIEVGALQLPCTKSNYTTAREEFKELEGILMHQNLALFEFVVASVSRLQSHSVKSVHFRLHQNTSKCNMKISKFIDNTGGKLCLRTTEISLRSLKRIVFSHCFVTMKPFFTQQLTCWHHAYKQHAHFDSWIHLQPHESMQCAWRATIGDTVPQISEGK